MTINPQFKSLIPPLAPEEREQLEKNIIADGCRDPLVVWGDVLIDGHNRFEICEKHGVRFATKAIDFDDERSARIWIRNNQRGRRNLSDAWKIELALGNKEDLAAAGVAKMATAGKKHGTKAKEGLSNNDKPSPDQKHDTRKQIAQAAKVSTGKVAQSEVIKKKSQELWDQCKAGELTIGAAYKKVTVHVGQNSGENEWYTPALIIQLAREAMGSIDCDPASSDLANKTVEATEFFTKDADGLSKKWSGNVWLNPPYAQPLIYQFSKAVADKFASKEIDQACVLINNATETEWFRLIADQSSAICFPKSRIKFIDQDGKPSGAPLQGQAIVYLGHNRGAFVKAFSDMGIVCYVVR